MKKYHVPYQARKMMTEESKKVPIEIFTMCNANLKWNFRRDAEVLLIPYAMQTRVRHTSYVNRYFLTAQSYFGKNQTLVLPDPGPSLEVDPCGPFHKPKNSLAPCSNSVYWFRHYFYTVNRRTSTCHLEKLSLKSKHA